MCYIKFINKRTLNSDRFSNEDPCNTSIVCHSVVHRARCPRYVYLEGIIPFLNYSALQNATEPMKSSSLVELPVLTPVSIGLFAGPASRFVGKVASASKASFEKAGTWLAAMVSVLLLYSATLWFELHLTTKKHWPCKHVLICLSNVSHWSQSEPKLWTISLMGVNKWMYP